MTGRSGRGFVAALAVFALAMAGALGAFAQDATPDEGTDGGTVAHPAHVHEGTCVELDPNPAYPLDDVAPVDGEPAGTEAAIPVEQSVTAIDVSLDDLLGSPHAINVHESSDNLENYIACGDLGGAITETDEGGRGLAVGLAEQNDSGYSGVAWLQDDGSGGTTVTIFLVREVAGTAAGADGADDGEVEEVVIEIVDFFFEPAEVTVPVGTTVTWINVGPTDHTTTAFIDGDKYWDSAIMSEGDTFSFTFEEPGTFEYLCALHPSMTATLIVEE